MKNKILTLAFFAIATSAIAGELAVLENLGFSPDGRYFMFGQHALVTDQGQAYAELALVDVPRNQFVSNGVQRGSWDVAMRPGQDSRGALLELLAQASVVKSRYDISHLETGRLLYVRTGLDEEVIETASDEEDKSVEAESSLTTTTLLFRDFESGGREFQLILNQENNGTEDSPKASFYIDITVTDPTGLARDYRIGRPGYGRNGVALYRIDRVWLGPDGRSVVVAVAKVSPDNSTYYMVETLSLGN